MVSLKTAFDLSSEEVDAAAPPGTIQIHRESTIALKNCSNIQQENTKIMATFQARPMTLETLSTFQHGTRSLLCWSPRYMHSSPTTLLVLLHPRSSYGP